MIAPPLTPRPANADGKDKVTALAGLGLLGAMIAADRQSRKEQMVGIRGSAAEPEFGVEAFARPGEAVFATYNFDQVATLVTTEDFITSERYRRPAGQVYYRMVVGKFCKADGKECVEDKDRDGDLDKVGRVDGKKVDVSYKEGFERFPFSGGFRTELLFLGLAKGVLRMQYREFQNDLARPAFSQELTYEIESFPATLYFQNLRLEVAEAGNHGILYKAFSTE
jgi:hypothetical protein